MKHGIYCQVQILGPCTCGADEPEPSGETIAQREEVCAAWADLPPELTDHPAMQRLYRALGGIATRGVGAVDGGKAG